MDVLIQEILETVSFNSALYFKKGFCSPWGMDIPKGKLSQFHLVAKGQCLLISGQGTVNLERGDIVIFPHGDEHQIKDALHSPCRAGSAVVREVLAGKEPFSGTRESTQLVCGHYELDTELSHPIFSQLPPLLVVKENQYQRFDLIHSLTEWIVEEMDRKQPGFQLISLKFAEILFLSVIRHYYLQEKPERPSLFRDKPLLELIERLHQHIDEAWTIDQLAKELGVSRTLFIARFKKALGMPPMKYLTTWRMTRARYLLSHTRMPLPEIGEKVGYPSETSFNRAFKNFCAISPGKYRKEKQVR